MSEIHDFKDLIIWQKSMDLAERIYDVTKGFPKDELFGMRSQMRRASVSIPSNVAEGWGRGTTIQYIHFLNVAKGSLNELETQVRLSLRTNLITQPTMEELINLVYEIGRMHTQLVKALKTKIQKTAPIRRSSGS